MNRVESYIIGGAIGFVAGVATMLLIRGVQSYLGTCQQAT